MLTVDGQSRRFARLAAPPAAERKLDELCRVAGASRPQLLWCESLGGKGGVSGGGMIAVGVRDQLHNADRVARETGCDLGAAERAAIEITIAHELGHAALHEQGIHHEEDDADAWALSACELAGWRTPVHDAVTRVVKENRAKNRASSNKFSDVGQVTCSIAAVRGIDRTSPNFRAKLIQIAGNVGVNVDWLAAVISFETRGTFDPAIQNPQPPHATGLIQFTPDTARRLGTTTVALAAMTAEQQLDYVERYFAPYRGRLGSLCSTYAVVFAERCLAASPETVAYSAPSDAYNKNAKLDTDHDGAIRCGEVCAQVQIVLANAGSNRVDAPCALASTVVTPAVAAGGVGAGTLLLAAAIVGAGVTFPRWRGAVGL